MAGKHDAATMSVSQMGELLGLGKTDSYWLVHKNLFETVIIAGKMRIVKKSFEEWYANQVHYHKVTGDAPGEALSQTTYSSREVANMLGIQRSCVYDLVHRYQLPTVTVNQQWRISKEAFNEWYKSQEHFRTTEDRIRDKALEDASIPLADVGRLLGLTRDQAYLLANKYHDQLEIVRIAGRKRVMKDSFEKWFNNQTKYQMLAPVESSSPQVVPTRNESMQPQKPQIDPDKLYSLSDVAAFLDKSEKTVYRWISRKKLPARLIGRVWKILGKDILEREDE